MFYSCCGLRSRAFRKHLLNALALILSALLAHPALAQTRVWDGGDGDWFLNTNWSDDTIPTASNRVNINNDSTVTIDSDGARARSLNIGDIVGPGKVVIDGALDTWDLTTPIDLGFPGNHGELEILNGSQVFGNELQMAGFGTGTATIDGVGTELALQNNAEIGFMRDASLTISDGAVLSGPGVEVATSGNASNTGTLNIGAGGGAGILNVPEVEGHDGNGTAIAILNFNHSDDPYYFTNDGLSDGTAVLITGTMQVNHAGTGTTVLEGDHTYSNATTINAGTLQVNGSIVSASTVNAGGSLGGTGTAAGVTVTGGSIAPGNSAGTLSTGALVLDSASTLNMELDVAGVVGGGVNDLIAVTGDLTLDGSLAITDLGNFGHGSYTLLTYTGTLTDNGLDLPAPFPNMSYTLNTGGGAITLDVEEQHALAYSTGVGGSLTGTTSQTVLNGNSGSAVTAVADAGFQFNQWSDASTDNPRTDVNVTAPITVTAQFAQLHDLNYSAGANGSLTGTASQTVLNGNSGSAVTAVADAGFRFTQWSDTSTDNPRTDVNVTAPITVTAQFAQLPQLPPVHNLSYSASANGFLTGTTVQIVLDRTSGSAVTAVADTGFQFTQWSDGSTDNPRTDMNVTTSLSVTAQFAPDSAEDQVFFGGDGELLSDISFGPDAVITNAVLGSGVEIHPDAQFGAGVCFDQPDFIPSDFDPQRLFQPSPTGANSDVTALNIDHSVVCNEPTLFEEIGLIDALQESGSLLELDGETGELAITLPDSLANLLPVKILVSDPDTPAGINQGVNGNLQLITGTGYTIVFQPLVQDEIAYSEIFAALGFSVRIDQNGNLILESTSSNTSPMEYFIARPVVPAIVVASDTPTGISVSGSPSTATITATLGNGTTVSQLLVSWPAHWQALSDSLSTLADVTAVSIDQQGLVSLHIDNQLFRLYADYAVLHDEDGIGAEEITIDETGDINSDGTPDYLIHYTNGDRQVLFVLPL